MTISFECPECGQFCAFDSQYAGRKARCTKCGQRFIIPDTDGGRPKRINESLEKPLPDYYRKLSTGTFSAIVQKESLTVNVFLLVLITLRFYLANKDYSVQAPGFTLHMPVGWITLIVTWGCQLWIYMEVVEATYMGFDEFIEAELGTGLTFFWTIIKTIYFFICALIVSALPFLVIGVFLENYGLDIPWLRVVLLCCSVILVPMVLLIMNSGQEIFNVFRLDYILRPILRAPLPYLSVVLILIVGVLIQAIFIRQMGMFDNPTPWLLGLHVCGNVLSGFILLVAMRGIGLFGRHYSCYLPWL